MKLGHSLLTHGYLVNNDVPDVSPHCELCNNASLSVILVIMESEQLIDARRACLEVYKYYMEPNIGELLGRSIRISEILTFLRNTGPYDLI